MNQQMMVNTSFNVGMLQDVRSAADLLERCFGTQVESIELPIDLEMVMQQLQGVRYTNELNFDNLLDSGFVKVERNHLGIAESIHVWVNPTEPSTRQRFTLAHELGHLIFDVYPHIEDALRDEVITDKRVTLNRNGAKSYRETRANRFAAQLLMPAKLIEREFKHLREKLLAEQKRISRERLVELFAQKFDVSREAMRIRLQDLKYI